MAITSAFQADDVGSIPITCSSRSTLQSIMEEGKPTRRATQTKALTATILRLVKRIRHFPSTETTLVRTQHCSKVSALTT